MIGLLVMTPSIIVSIIFVLKPFADLVFGSLIKWITNEITCCMSCNLSYLRHVSSLCMTIQTANLQGFFFFLMDLS
jgi:hypothetical protein